MKTLQFNITDRYSRLNTIGTAEVFENYNEAREAYTSFFMEAFELTEQEAFDQIKTNKIGEYEGKTVYESYIDSGSGDYFYFAI